ncbi:MAG TPA: nicotinate-nucleotide adenylyltransferase [Microbacteriaceae bacterium]|nr:nicotinate-nucleotide adenylyltransferase [Microbacteriaceae bacterium]
MPTRVGVFGGSFDPPHLGHLLAATAAFETLGLDLVLWVPTGDQSHKASTSAAHHRLEMVRLATAGEARFAVSTVDIDREGPTYSIDTVTDLRGLYSDAEFTFLLGDDAWAGIDSWHRSSELTSLVQFAVLSRTTVATEAEAESLRWVRIPRIEMSSTECRERVRAGQGLRYRVPDSVAEYIENHKLYLEGA